MLILALSGLAGCVADDPTVPVAMRDDQRCRALGAVPENPTYVRCRLEAVQERDRVYAERLAAEAQAREAAAASGPPKRYSPY